MVRIKSAVIFVVVFLAVLGVLSSDIRAQVATNVRSFTSGAMANPQFLTLAQGRDATIYGATFGFFPTAGAIFRLQTNGAGGQLYAFDTTSGASPDGGLTLATDGNLYGTTSQGGTASVGVLFRISSSGVYTVLHNFAGTDGAFPAAPPIEASDGSLYGTTAGVVTNSTVYKYARDGSFTTIYQFNDPNKGVGVQWPLIEGADGSLYGAAPSGGTNSCGTIFRLSKSGVLLRASSFPCGAGGSFPDAPLVQTSDGTFYGTTDLGGTQGLGAIFKMDQKGKIAILYSFRGEPNDGARPVGGLTQATDGKLYGIAGAGGSNNIGALFSITTTGTYSFLYSFSSDVGSSPEGTLFQHTNGSFYGATTQGGANNAGTIFAVDAGLQPFITFVLATGKIGQSAQILGQGLTGSTGVSFNGVAAATFHVVSDTYMTAVVPSGATTGLVTVAAPGGTLTSNRDYRIIKQSTKGAASRPQGTIPKQK